jgi:oxygen-independent coproporphyrinogen-3 oxidase
VRICHGGNSDGCLRGLSGCIPPSGRSMSLGIYIHIPFCRTKCNYCHFVIRPWKAASAERYHRALLRELALFFEQNPAGEEADSIYIGGGTPTLVPADYIADVLEACRKFVVVSRDCEISVEANPGTLTPEKVRAYCALGINRVSIGAQSFGEAELAAIGRDHTGYQIDESVQLLRQSGIQNINLDMMLGLPEQSAGTWARDLDRCAALSPEHVSVYMLDLDGRTPLYHHIARGRCSVPEDDLVSDLYLGTRSFWEERGYQQYEISNFSLAGHQCRHNLKYWLRRPVLGFGVGSHSYDGCARYANHGTMKSYLDAVEAGRSPVEWLTRVESSQALEETLFLGLRLNQGLDWRRLSQNFNPCSLGPYEESLRLMSERGLLEWRDSVVRLTPRGMLLSNEVFQSFV